MTRGDGLAATLGVLVVAGGLAAGCGGGADVMRATLTADGCTYEGDTTPAPGVFRVEVRNETHDVANFAVAELAEGARIEEIEPWYENERRKLEQPGPYDFNPTQFVVVGPARSSVPEQAVSFRGRAGTMRQSWPADYPDRAPELHANGLSCPKVAEELGVPFATAKFWIWPPATPARPPAALAADNRL